MEVVLTKKYIKQHAKAPVHIKEKSRLILLKLEKANGLSEINDVKQLGGIQKLLQNKNS